MNNPSQIKIEEDINLLLSDYSGTKKYQVRAGYDVYEDNEFLLTRRFSKPFRILADDLASAVTRTKQACQQVLDSRRELMRVSEHSMDIVSILDIVLLKKPSR